MLKLSSVNQSIQMIGLSDDLVVYIFDMISLCGDSKLADSLTTGKALFFSVKAMALLLLFHRFQPLEDPPQGNDDPKGEDPPQGNDDPQGEDPPQKNDDPQGEDPPQKNDDPQGEDPPQKNDDPQGKYDLNGSTVHLIDETDIRFAVIPPNVIKCLPVKPDSLIFENNVFAISFSRFLDPLEIDPLDIEKCSSPAANATFKSINSNFSRFRDKVGYDTESDTLKCVPVNFDKLLNIILLNIEITDNTPQSENISNFCCLLLYSLIYRNQPFRFYCLSKKNYKFLITILNRLYALSSVSNDTQDVTSIATSLVMILLILSSDLNFGKDIHYTVCN
eukprot:GHVL01013476.1.p1 GENE.GHVL01013476.1~~GHVL01013476.1.p1  ORF type:complete len:334 (-),score=107.30 GHVL01013476.1:12-1013(-)